MFGAFIKSWVLGLMRCHVPRVDMARYGPFNNPQKIVGSCNLGNLGNFWHEMANSEIAKSVIYVIKVIYLTKFSKKLAMIKKFR